MFNPGNEFKGIHELISTAINKCGGDLHEELWRNVFLSGGTSLLTNLPERLKKELIELCPQGEDWVQVHAPENRLNSVYQGANTMC